MLVLTQLRFPRPSIIFKDHFYDRTLFPQNLILDWTRPEKKP